MTKYPLLKNFYICFALYIKFILKQGRRFLKGPIYLVICYLLRACSRLAFRLIFGLLLLAYTTRPSRLSAILRSVLGYPGNNSKPNTLRNTLKSSYNKGLVRPSATYSYVRTYSSSTWLSRITSRSQYY